jgi:hypothetical protein
VAFQTIMLEKLFPGMTIEPHLTILDLGKRAGVANVPSLFEVSTREGRHGTEVESAQYVGTPEQLAKLDVLVDVDASQAINQVRAAVEEAATRFEGMLDLPFDIAWANLDAKCKDCEFRDPDSLEGTGFHRCWGDLATVKPHVLELFSIGTVKTADRKFMVESLVAENRASLFDIPEECLTKADGSIGANSLRQRRQIDQTRANEPWMSNALKGQVAALEYPLYFIDFEASRLALPYHTDMRPYGQVAFQWSCHRVDAPGVTPVHTEWLNTEDAWPNLRFARSLRDTLGSQGSVLTWSKYERSQLAEIAREHEVFADFDEELVQWISDLDERLVDLHDWAKNDFYHPSMKGRTSIKVVLDALWKSDGTMREQHALWTGLDVGADEDPYKALPALVVAGVEQSVHEGTGAVRAYEAMMYGAERHDEIVKANWRQLLLQYCELDTLSMILVLEHWRRITGLGPIPPYTPILGDSVKT